MSKKLVIDCCNDCPHIYNVDYCELDDGVLCADPDFEIPANCPLPDNEEQVDEATR